jgi:DNA-binding XRE family transcriptional regulator
MKVTSMFIELLGDSPTVRVLDHLITERDLDFSKTDMAKNAGVSRATLYRLWNDLIKNKIIIHTRIIGRAKLYKLNTSLPQIKKLTEIFDIQVIEELKRRSKSQKLSVKPKP